MGGNVGGGGEGDGGGLGHVTSTTADTCDMIASLPWSGVGDFIFTLEFLALDFFLAMLIKYRFVLCWIKLQKYNKNNALILSK